MVTCHLSHLFDTRRILGAAQASFQGMCVVLMCLFGAATAADYAEAQCLKITTTRGKARLSTTPLGFNGKCPIGSVAIGAGTGAVGAPGAQGPQGPQGPAGAPGARGASAFDTIPSGTTVHGVLGMRDFRAANDSFIMYASLPAKAGKAIKGADVIIKANAELLSECSGMKCLAPRQQAGQSRCPGTAANPSAAPGTVCVYPTYVYGGISDGSFDGDDIWVGESSGTTAGFSISYWTDLTANHWIEAVWAYTAP
jgi:hypothetical protein